jgi:hypothetical protein
MFHGLDKTTSNPRRYPPRAPDRLVRPDGFRFFMRRADRHAAREKTPTRTSRSARLTIPSTVLTPGWFSKAPAPVATAKAQAKSPMHAPSPTLQVCQKPPPWSLESNPRRIISALTGPGGQATDHPSTNPFNRIDIDWDSQRRAAAKIASRLFDTSRSVVAQDETLIRIALRPFHTVPPHQQVPSA